jgi:hypothetical protein
VLLEQDATELGQRVCPCIVERPQDAPSIGDRERDDSGPHREHLLEERACRLADEPYELANVLVGDPQAGEIHKGRAYPVSERLLTAAELAERLASKSSAAS